LRTSSGECHMWKDQLNRVTGAFLAAADEKEFPQAGNVSLPAQQHQALHRAAQRMLDNRPFGCL
jgi:hypothetical protein